MSDKSNKSAIAVRVDHLSHSFGPRVVLNDLTISLPAGQMTALLGPNGSGKTTLFRIITTLLRPVKGIVEIFGHDVATNAAAIRGLIGVVFQHPAIDPQLTAFENLTYHARLYGVASGEIAPRALACLEQVDLIDRAGDKVKTFSGGMKRRLEIAKAILPGPRLLLLDEPDTGLDPGARQHLRDLLLRLVREQGTTVFTTTHLMEMADVADRVLLLHQGKMLADGSPGQLCSSIGGDVLTLDVADAESVAVELVAQLHLPARVIENHVRVEMPDVYQQVSRVVERMGTRLNSLSVSRPTLNDVFLKLTGNGLQSPE